MKGQAWDVCLSQSLESSLDEEEDELSLVLLSSFFLFIDIRAFSRSLRSWKEEMKRNP